MEDARKNIYLVDSKGLVTSSRSNLAHHKVPYAHDVKVEGDTKTLIDCVKGIKPTAIIGVSAMPGTFTKEVIEVRECVLPNSRVGFRHLGVL